MTPTQWERVKELFDEALGPSAQRRSSVLGLAEREGPEVRAGLDKLFADHDHLIAESSPFVLDDVQIPPISSLARTFAPGDLVADRYRIVRFIAEGGMGEVYEAEDLELGHPVALKVLREELKLDPEALARFKVEIALAQRVTHPNVCRIYDLGRHRVPTRQEGAEDDVIVFLTMELLAGETLADYLDHNGRMPASQAISLARQMADALSALHEARVIHRDFKPGNVMLVPEEDGQHRAVITDLGLARSTSGTASADVEPSTKTLLICTPEYVAPEQLTGVPFGPTTDIYAFGLVLYEMVTGERPFSAPTPLGTLVKRLTTPARSPCEIVPDLHRNWESAIFRCIEREPAKRFKTPAEVVLALEGKLDWGVKRWVRIAASVAAVFVLVWLLWQVEFVRSGVLTQACNWFPGSALVCQLPADKDLAVLPFENLSADPEDRAFADGLMIHLTNGLYRLAPNKESMCVHVREDRNAFGVKLVLTGEVERTGDLVRIHATVRDAATQHLLRDWEREVPIADASTLHSGLLRDLVDQLELEIPEARWNVWDTEGSGQPEALEAYFQGLGHIKREEYEAASRAFDRATEHDFSFVLGHVGLGDAFRLLHTKTRDPLWATRARNVYQVAEGLSDQLPQTFYGLGQLEISLNNYEEAVRRFERALQVEPFDFNVRRKLAVAYEATNQFDETEKANQHTRDLRPQCWYVYNHLALFYLYRGRFDDALRYLLEVVRLAPDNGTAFNNLAFLYRKVGRFADALSPARKAIDLGYSALGHMNLGRAYFFLGCHSESARELERAAELDQRDPRIYSHLGETYRMLPDLPEKPQALFEHAVRLGEARLVNRPDDLIVLSFLALNLARTGQGDRAIEKINRALEIVPDNPELRFYQALVLELLGDRDRAIDALQQALASGYSIFYARRRPEFAGLRLDPEYARVVEQLGLDKELDPGTTPSLDGGQPCLSEPDAASSAANVAVQIAEFNQSRDSYWSPSSRRRHVNGQNERYWKQKRGRDRAEFISADSLQ